MGPAQQRVAGHLRPGLLRHRDDVGRRRRLRHQPARHGGLPGLAAPGRPHDRGRAGLPEDGAGPAPGLRPDDGAQVGHLHGRLRVDRRHVQQLRHRAGGRPDRPGRRLRPGLPAVARDAPARHPDAAREDPHRRDHPPPRDPPSRPASRRPAAGCRRCPTPCGWPRRGERAPPRPRPRRRPPGVLPEVPRLPDRLVDQLAFPRRDTYKQMVAAFRDAGFELCADLCAVDYLTHPGPLAARGRRRRSASRWWSTCCRSPCASACASGCRCPSPIPTVDSIVDVYPGADAMEREAYDLVGILFDGPPRHDPHPHARGLGGPPAAQGLRRGPGAGAVQGSARARDERPRPARHRPERAATSERDARGGGCPLRRPRSSALVAETSEGAQELLPRGTTTRRRAPPGGRRRPAPARGRLRRPGRHRHRAARRPDDDHQHGSPAPLHPRRAAAHARARRRDGAAHQADHRLPAHRHGEDRARS